MRKPFTPTLEQNTVLGMADSALVVAGPGTGKTRTAIEKAIRVATALPPSSRQQVLFLSFSNAAVHRLAEAAHVHVPLRQQRYQRFATYHALAAEILRLYGRFAGLPPTIRIVDRLEETLLALEQGWPADEFGYADCTRRIAKERGFITFNTMIDLAVTLLKHTPLLRTLLSRHYPLIIVDEFQDTSDVQWQLLQLVGAGSQVIAFGDPNQVIYTSLHAATARRMDQFREWKQVGVTPFSATNFRCGNAEILKFAEAMLTGTPYTKKDDSGVEFLDIKYRNRLRASLALIWKAIRDQIGKKETIAFLTSSNPLAEEVATGLRNPPESTKVSFPVFASIVRDEAAHDAVLLALVAIRDYATRPDERLLVQASIALTAMDLQWNSRRKRDGRKITELAKLIKGELAKDTPLSRVARQSSPPQGVDGLIPEFVKSLSTLKEFKTATKRMLAHERLGVERLAAPRSDLPLFDQLRTQRQPKGLYGYDAAKGTTHVINYHKTKGREFDFVAMVVDPRGESGKTDIEELRRLYYVCATRAKRWLGVLYYANEKGRVLGPVLS